MVASTPKKPLFEGNSPSNTETLFFEFALEPTPVSFKPQPNLSALPFSHSSKKILNIASKLVLGLLITALVLGSGVLNKELFMGKSGTQASLAWIPSWSRDLPATSETTTASDGISETADTPVSEPTIITSEANSASSTVVTVATGVDTNTEAPNLATTPTTETNTKVINATEPKEPTETPETSKSAFKPIIKPPVTKSSIKLSEPAVDRKAAVANKLEITSDAFHAITTASAMDGKKVFIKFGAQWCLPCKMMEANVFPDPEISQLLAENYHTFTVDVDNIDGVNLRQFFKVEGLPSFIILDDQQNVVQRHEGAKRIEELRSILGGTTP